VLKGEGKKGREKEREEVIEREEKEP